MKLKDFLLYKAYQLRMLSARATTAAGSGHLTSSLSAADIMAALFFHTMHIDLAHLDAPENDRFILSKGHAAQVLYATLKELGLISEQELLLTRTLASPLQGHPVPGCPLVDIATGSLGIGLSAGVGMALNARLKKLNYYTYVLLGDSELTEGAVWEAAALAAHYQLKNLIAIVDVNRLGQRGHTLEEYQLKKIAAKFTAFGWRVQTVNGHAVNSLVQVLNRARLSKKQIPQIILAKTIKGYGLRAWENRNGFHGKALRVEQLPAVERELKRRFYKVAWATIAQVPSIRQKKQVIKYPVIHVSVPVYKKGEMVATREAFGRTLVYAGQQSARIMCLDAEVSNSTYTDLFAQKYPERFVECFIAEQAMIGVAMGLTARDNLCVAATFSAFLTRAFDQLRMASISRLPLRIVGSHAGVSVGQDGPSQMGLEDIGMMRALMGSLVLCPCDAVSCQKICALMLNYHDGISYLRTLRCATPVIYAPNTQFTIGGFYVLKQSSADCVLVIAAGICVHEALIAHDILQKKQVNIAVVDLYCIKPLDAAGIIKLAYNCANNIVVVEDHYQAGGVYEAVCTQCVNADIKFYSLAIKKLPGSASGSQLMHEHGIDAQAIVQLIRTIL